MTLVDFLNGINGQPWTEERHCLALASEIQLRFFGRSIPLVPLPETPAERHAAIHGHPVMTEWKRVEGPAHGAMVLMSSREKMRIDRHIGVCMEIPEPVIAHTDNPQGVCVDDVMTLLARGWHPTYWLPA